MEIGLTHILSVIGTLVGVVGVLWRVIDFYAKRELDRHDRAETELKTVRKEQIGLLTEVAHLKGEIQGQRALSARVLDHITELKDAKND